MGTKLDGSLLQGSVSPCWAAERHPRVRRSKTVKAMPPRSRLWYQQGSLLWLVAACACHFILWVTSRERHVGTGKSPEDGEWVGTALKRK